MAERIAFEVNEETRTVEVAPDTPLLYVLRNELGLSNPHFGCGLAQCGACTVHVDGAPTRSCSAAGIGGGRDQGDDARRARQWLRERDGLSAGGRWIRTSGPPSAATPLSDR